MFLLSRIKALCVAFFGKKNLYILQVPSKIKRLLWRSLVD
jgi:hypothetical protein